MVVQSREPFVEQWQDIISDTVVQIVENRIDGEVPEWPLSESYVNKKVAFVAWLGMRIPNTSERPDYLAAMKCSDFRITGTGGVLPQRMNKNQRVQQTVDSEMGRPVFIDIPEPVEVLEETSNRSGRTSVVGPVGYKVSSSVRLQRLNDADGGFVNSGKVPPSFIEFLGGFRQGKVSVIGVGAGDCTHEVIENCANIVDAVASNESQIIGRPPCRLNADEHDFPFGFRIVLSPHAVWSVIAVGEGVGLCLEKLSVMPCMLEPTANA